MFEPLAQAIDGSALNKLALDLLSNVPGFPPIVQTVHLLAIAAIMGSIVVIDLKVLGLALPSQSTSELVRRLMPWTWSALPILAASGLVFILARPYRYFVNPVVGAKFAMLLPAIVLAALFQRLNSKNPSYWEGTRVSARLIAVLSLCLWIGVALAGRWIAYVDYLFPTE
jgi:hypothetical protein